MKPFGDAARRKTLLTLAWLAAFSAGAFVLVPSISEFFQAREMAKEDRERAVLAEKTMVENARVLEFTLNDPQKDEKLLEQYGLENRKSEE